MISKNITYGMDDDEYEAFRLIARKQKTTTTNATIGELIRRSPEYQVVKNLHDDTNPSVGSDTVPNQLAVCQG